MSTAHDHERDYVDSGSLRRAMAAPAALSTASRAANAAKSDARGYATPRVSRVTQRLSPDRLAVIALQRAAGNHAVSMLLGSATREVQRCGSDTSCDCSLDGREEAEPGHASPHAATQQVQRKTAGDVPELTFEPAVNKPPCACVVHVHNEERKARKTARLLHTNCRYNLATVQDPDALKARKIQVPKHGEKDPNSLFPDKIINACMNDEKACRDFLIDKKTSTKPGEILGFAQRQYFLAIKDCSTNFTLPVVALHNNALTDTDTYRAKMGREGVADLKLDVDKRDKKTGADVLNTIRKLINDKFGERGEKETLDTDETTNIYRWCKSDDIERCHIGNPDHPDNVIWVTNPADFERLKKTNVNVVFESQKPKSAKSESAGDLSTMFVLISLRLIGQWEKQASIAGSIVGKRFWNELSYWLHLALLDPTPEDAAAQAKENKILTDALAAMIRLGPELEKLEKLRFVNIETEGKGWGKESERVANYRAIVAILKDLGIHCCNVGGKGDASVEAGLKGEDK